DRTKDVIKSGGEWISSVDLENMIMAHPHVLEAAVVAVPHPTWVESVHWRAWCPNLSRAAASVVFQLNFWIDPPWSSFSNIEGIILMYTNLVEGPLSPAQIGLTRFSGNEVLREEFRLRLRGLAGFCLPVVRLTFSFGHGV